MGSNQDYSRQIDTALAQANMPKSSLSQEFSGLLGGAAPNILSALMNTQNLGNAFVGLGQQQTTPIIPRIRTNLPYNDTAPQPLKAPSSAGTEGWNNTNWWNSSGLADFSRYFKDALGRDPTQADVDQFGPQVANMSWDDVPNFLKSNVGVRNSTNTPTFYADGLIGSPDTPMMNNVIDSSLTRLATRIPGTSEATQSTNTSAKENQYFQQGQGFGLGLGPNGVPINPLMQAGMSGMNLGLPFGGENSFSFLNNNNIQLPQIGQPNINLNNPSQQLFDQSSRQFGNILGQAMNGPGMVNNQNVNAPGFQQQMINPGMINAGFNPVTANLSGVPNSTQLDPSNADYYNSVAQIANQQQEQNIKDLRERFTGWNTSHGTGAMQAEAMMRAQGLPQLTAALGNVRQQEVGNQLNQAGLQQSGLLQNAGMLNQFGLGNAQLQAGNQGQNISNQMNAANLNNLTALQAGGMNLQAALANASNNLQAQGMNQSAGLNFGQNMNSLLNTIGGIGSQAGAQGLGNAQLGSSNFFNAAGQNSQNMFNQQNLQSQNAMGLLGQLFANQQGNNSLLNNLGQFNAGQGNAYNLSLAGMNQSAAQQQIQNQLESLKMLFGSGLGLAGAGIPGGSTNVNIGNSQSNGGFGSALTGIGSILAAFA